MKKAFVLKKTLKIRFLVANNSQEKCKKLNKHASLKMQVI